MKEKLYELTDKGLLSHREHDNILLNIEFPTIGRWDTLKRNLIAI